MCENLLRIPQLTKYRPPHVCDKYHDGFIRIHGSSEGDVAPNTDIYFTQGKSEGFDSCDRPSNLT